MTPPWNPKPGEEQERFTAFIIERLEEAEEDRALRFAAAMLSRSDDPNWLSKVREQHEAEKLARKHGGVISWPEDTPRKGRPRKVGRLARAARDVPRIRNIFAEFWPDKTRRVTPPSAEDIAAVRWGLSDEEKDKLYKSIHRN